MSTDTNIEKLSPVVIQSLIVESLRLLLVFMTINKKNDRKDGFQSIRLQ